MNAKKNRTASFVLLLTCCAASPAAIERIDAASERARAALEAAHGQVSPEVEASLRELDAALENGERINTSLKEQVQALEEETEKLEQAQIVLKSGLIGALVTAIVAILGAFVTSRNSKPERDLKRLAVIEKVRELKAANVKLPPDLARADGADS